MATELVIRVDLSKMLEQAGIPEPSEATKPELPSGYRCQTCWRDDGKHETTCEFHLHGASQAAAA